MNDSAGGPVTLYKEEVKYRYRKIAKRYDLLAHLYYLVGFRGRSYRKMAVWELDLHRGDTVIDIGCGTGMNFPFIQKKVGREGKIIGIDLSGNMLHEARKRVRKSGWPNVELIQCDAAMYDFPEGIGGILSAFSMRFIPEYDSVIRRGIGALIPGRRFVILDTKIPDNRPGWWVDIFLLFGKPFGVSRLPADHRPWESIEIYMKNKKFSELYLGFAYICVGEAPTGVLEDRIRNGK